MFKKLLLLFGALGILMLVPVAQAGTIATISGCYDCVTYDTPSLIFHNTTNTDFTNTQMVLTGYNGLNNGLSQTVSLGTMTANSDTTINWSGSTGPFFLYDYDDSLGFQAPCPFNNPVNSGLCAQIGNFKVTFTAMWGTTPIYSVFSPDSNATGSFVGWEGVDQAGWSEDPSVDVHTGSLTGVLANINVGTPPTPEPSTLVLLASGLLGFGWKRARNQK